MEKREMHSALWSLGIAMSYELDGRDIGDQFPCRGKEQFSAPQHHSTQTSPETHKVSCSMFITGSFSLGKSTKLEADHWNPSSAEVKTLVLFLHYILCLQSLLVNYLNTGIFHRHYYLSFEEVITANERKYLTQYFLKRNRHATWSTLALFKLRNLLAISAVYALTGPTDWGYSFTSLGSGYHKLNSKLYFNELGNISSKLFPYVFRKPNPLTEKVLKTLCGLTPWANYTDWASVACRWS
jgi:hypothetical protein